jgi:hypothetical protein
MAATPEIVGYWESIAERRLGRYITGVQRQVLELGMRLRPAPRNRTRNRVRRRPLVPDSGFKRLQCYLHRRGLGFP